MIERGSEGVMRDMRVVDYDSDWPAACVSEIALLRSVLGDLIVRAHHIGSTAVPGLAAKPVIDVCVEVSDLGRLDGYDDAMRALGYEPRGEFGIPGRRYYPKGGEARTHHVHAYAVGDPHVEAHLAFRDYLRAHPGIAIDYARTKREGAAKHRHDPDGYCAFKDRFVAGTVADALAWARSSGRASAS